ncbi:hypothetical protein NW754_009145 [Fusarium falciforme]|nr:hypothetical protein NW754_009145 [Fusarium falciforme]
MAAPSSTSNMASNPQVAVDHDDDAPPPPYSETDIYSTTSGPPRSPLSASGPALPGDDAASRISSTSTTDPVIFTPPLTPNTANPSTPTQQHIQVPPSPSAALYFEGRDIPVSTPRPAPRLYTVAVKPSSVPEDLPYPLDWAPLYDITHQDWATFVNYLLPDHASVTNEAILGEKGKGIDEGSDIKSEKQIADPNDVIRKRAEVEATVQQWNDGFFAPRNVRVQLQAEEQPHMPGGWDTAFDGPSAPAEAGPSSQREAGPSNQAGPRPAWGNGWMGSWGGLKVGNDSIRWKDSIVADSNGLRIGNLVMDSNGIRMNGRDPGPPFGHGEPSRGFCPPGQRGRTRSRGDGSPFGHGHPYFHPGNFDANGTPLYPGQPEQRKSRSRSSSSSSSSSSCSSNSSGSIGSLPDYDDVKDQQLPLYLARLEEWVARPGEMRTKADVKQLKAELKASKTNAVDPNLDRKALKAQAKALSQQWRTLKRQQKKERRERRRDLKKRRRAEKRERRQQKREMKRAQKEHRRGHAGPPPVPHAPHMPPMPAVPGVSVPPPLVALLARPGVDRQEAVVDAMEAQAGVASLEVQVLGAGGVKEDGVTMVLSAATDHLVPTVPSAPMVP